METILKTEMSFGPEKEDHPMVGPREKGVSLEKITRLKESEKEKVDLRVLPKYICFKAALLKTSLMYQYGCSILAFLLVGMFFVFKSEETRLHKLLREKEYILAPGVLDFTPASAQMVPDSYVRDTIQEFTSQLGNFTSTNIGEQYQSLSEAMRGDLKVKFQAESSSFIEKVKEEGISELIDVEDKKILSVGSGTFHAEVYVRRHTYLQNEYLGEKNEVIEMELQLIPPKPGKKWYMQINELKRQSAEAFRAKKRM